LRADRFARGACQFDRQSSLGLSRSSSGGRFSPQMPEECASCTLPPRQTNFLFKPVGPCLTRAVVREVQPCLQLDPRQAFGTPAQFFLDGVSEFNVAHGGSGLANSPPDEEGNSSVSCRPSAIARNLYHLLLPFPVTLNPGFSDHET
jgi:hypothetical protein